MKDLIERLERKLAVWKQWSQGTEVSVPFTLAELEIMLAALHSRSVEEPKE